MGEYSRATLASNLATIPGNGDRLKSMEERWMECFRIVDTVLAKVVHVQRLHMSLICEFVAFSDTDNKKDVVEMQRKECEHLEEEMRSLMKKMLEQAMGSRGNESEVLVLPICTEENVSPLPNPGFSTFKCDPWVEIKQENDTELIEEKNGNVEFSSTVMLGSNQSSSPFVNEAVSAEDKIRDEGLTQNAEFASPKEWNNAFAIPTEEYIPNEILPDSYEDSCETDGLREIVYQPEIYGHSTNVPPMLPADLAFEVVMSIRGNPMLVFNQCKYKFSRIKADGTVSWRCFVDGCKAILETDANRTRILDEKNIHVHEPTNNNDVEKIKSSTKDIPENTLLLSDRNACGSVEEENYDILEASVKTEDCSGSRSSTEFDIPVIQEHESSAQHECELCSKKFNRKDNLTAHMRRHNCEKPCECEVCSNKFSDRQSLAVHMRIHNGEKPYECKVCKRRFRQASNLSTHMRMHNGEKPFVCKVCSRKFSEAGSLITHIRIHSGEKPYECEVCARKFSQSGSWKRHVRMHNGGKPFECEVCSRKFSQRSHLVSHMRRHNSGKP